MKRCAIPVIFYAVGAVPQAHNCQRRAVVQKDNCVRFKIRKTLGNILQNIVNILNRCFQNNIKLVSQPARNYTMACLAKPVGKPILVKEK